MSEVEFISEKKSTRCDGCLGDTGELLTNFGKLKLCRKCIDQNCSPCIICYTLTTTKAGYTLCPSCRPAQNQRCIYEDNSSHNMLSYRCSNNIAITRIADNNKPNCWHLFGNTVNRYCYAHLQNKELFDTLFSSINTSVIIEKTTVKKKQPRKYKKKGASRCSKCGQLGHNKNNGMFHLIK